MEEEKSVDTETEERTFCSSYYNFILLLDACFVWKSWKSSWLGSSVDPVSPVPPFQKMLQGLERSQTRAFRQREAGFGGADCAGRRGCARCGSPALLAVNH